MLNERLREAREALGLSQREAARRIGIGPDMYGLLENRRRAGSMSLWRAIQKFYGWSDGRLAEAMSENAEGRN